MKEFCSCSHTTSCRSSVTLLPLANLYPGDAIDEYAGNWGGREKTGNFFLFPSNKKLTASNLSGVLAGGWWGWGETQPNPQQNLEVGSKDSNFVRTLESCPFLLWGLERRQALQCSSLAHELPVTAAGGYQVILYLEGVWPPLWICSVFSLSGW